MDQRVPCPVPKNTEPTEQTAHTLNAFRGELRGMVTRVEFLLSQMSAYGIDVLPEATREYKRSTGVTALKTFIDELEATVNHEIRHNVKDVSDVSD